MKLSEEKLTYLLFLYDMRNQNHSLTNLAGKLGVSKSTLSKTLSAFYQEGMIQEKGKCQLSCYGCLTAKKWQSDIDKISQWLSNFGNFSIKDAKREALHLALYMSESAKEQLVRYTDIGRFLDSLDHIKMIHGDMLIAHLEVGEYPFALTLYKDKISDNLELSMSNDGFIHPGYLKIEQGKGYLVLVPCEMERESLLGKIILKGKLAELKYLKDHQFVEAVQFKDRFLIPLSCLEFYYNSQERLLQGHIKLKMKSTVGIIHMPESTAILSIVFK